MENVNTLEWIVAVATCLNIYLHLNIKNAILALKLEISEKYVRKGEAKHGGD